MKKILIIIGILINFIVVSSCKSDEYEAPNEFRSALWYTSFGDAIKDDIIVNAGSYVSFSDLSNGAIKHVWEIDEGNNFLKGELPKNGKNENNESVDFSKYIFNEGKITANEKIVGVLFNKGPISTVKLTNTYDKFVSVESREGVISTVLNEETGEYVLEKTFRFQVYEPVKPLIKLVKQDGEVIDHTVPGVLEFEVGDVLTFEDLSNSAASRADSRSWIFREENETRIFQNILTEANFRILENPNLDYVFVKPGRFTVEYRLQRAANTDTGIKRANERIILPLVFDIKPSSKDLTLAQEIIELKDQTLELKFNGLLNNIDDDIISNFTVNLNGSTANILSVELKNSDKSTIQIKLDEQIYKNDVINVSYDGVGNLTSEGYTDKAVLFSEKPVTMYSINITPFLDPGFEDILGAGSTTWTKFIDPSGLGDVIFTNEITPFEGLQCAKFTSPQKPRLESKNQRINFESGTYVVSFKLYVPSETILTPNLGQRVWIGGGSANADVKWNTVDPFVKDSWQEFKVKITVANDIPNTFIRFQAVPSNANVTYYLDDIKIEEDDNRPL